MHSTKVVKDIELGFVRRGVHVEPHALPGGIVWKYVHAGYYEDRCVRVHVPGCGWNRLDYCALEVQSLVTADILQRYPDLRGHA